MRLFICFITMACLIPVMPLCGADAPDGTGFVHSILSVDGPGLLRIKFCGLPLQLRLANVQFKSVDFEKESARYLKEVLRLGTPVKIELESESDGKVSFPLPVQLFSGSTHINLELIKRGLATSDCRSKNFSSAFQSAQSDAMSRKLGVWEVSSFVKPGPSITPIEPPQTTAKPLAGQPTESNGSQSDAVQAPAGYEGPVVADLSSKEYHFPGSRFAQSIRTGARIEYKSPEAAERAGKSPSPFSFADRARVIQEKQNAASATGGDGKIVEVARKAMADALVYMQDARRLSRTNGSAANENWKKAARILAEHIDRLTPLADASPHDQAIQKLASEMAMNLYSCNKYQSL